MNLVYKWDKKLKDEEDRINDAVDEYNRFKFEAKYNNAVLSERLR